MGLRAEPLGQGGLRPAERPRHVLVVDDSRAQRRMMALHLGRWGYRVSEAGSAEDALEICAASSVDIILSDWMMPGMTGVDFCRDFRGLNRDSYGYFILLTSKSDKADIAGGLEAGADDFLTKPVNPDELHARLRAGERIIGMQAELVEKNRLVGSTLDELQKLYDSLDCDLIEARKLQQTLVRDRFRDFGRGSASLLIRPSGHVGGDLVGCFEINSRRIALYSLDVSGHGVASAMMTARLAGLLSAASPEQNLALSRGSDGQDNAWPPEMVAYRFNRMMLDDLQVEQYFTMAYAEIDLETGKFWLVQAGHPHPVILRRDGSVEQLGDGGLPIGLVPGATYDRVRGQLHPGDRLFLVSDGMTECPGATGHDLGGDGLCLLLQKNAGLSSPALLEALVWDLVAHAGTEEFPDDVSGLMFDYLG